MIRHVKILQGHEGAIYKLQFDNSNRKLYSVGGDGWLVEWDPNHSSDGQLIARVPDQLFSLAITPHRFYLGSFQGNFYILDRNSGAILHEQRVHQRGIFSILVHEHHVLTLGGDGRIVAWDETSMQQVREYPLSGKALRVQALNPAGDVLAVGASDGSIYILSFPELYLQKQIESAHVPSVFALTWADNRLISGGRDALLKAWRHEMNYELELSLNAHWYAIYEVIATQEFLITASRDKTMRWWNRHTMEPVKTIQWGEVMEAHVHSVNTLAVDESRNMLFSGSEDRTIRIWQF